MASGAKTVRVASREEFSKLQHFRGTPKNIAAIDFGTTHCSVTYQLNSHHASVDDMPTILRLDKTVPQSVRVPSSILFDQNGNRLSCGWEAVEEYNGMDDNQRPDLIFLEHVKMKLHFEEQVDRGQKVTALNGKRYFLIDVIAHILCHLKDQLLEEVHDFGLSLNATDFDWVLTVPAIWKAKGKQMMREAGYKAGLCSSSQSPPRLMEARGFSPLRVTSDCPEKLSLALEPESAAIFCQQEAKKAKKSAGDKFLPTSNQYLVLDIGGGTVDIATHSVSGNGIEELAPSNGNDWGGTRVNMEFEKFLAKVVADNEFSSYLNESDAVCFARRKAEMTHLLYSEFETQKKLFGSDANKRSYKVRFPHTFYEHYGDAIKKQESNQDFQIEDNGAAIRLFPSKMAELFQPVVNGINCLIEKHLTENGLTDLIDTVYMIGGFGSSSYLRKQIEGKIKEIVPTIVTCTPPESQLAVIYGAFSFRRDPGIVTKRVADASYGIEYSVPFDPLVHCQEYKIPVPGKPMNYCKHIFGVIVEKGEHICTNEIFVAQGATSKEQKVTKVGLYSSLSKDVIYTTDRGVYKLGEVKLKLDEATKNSQVELIVDITHTELHLLAREIESGNHCKLVVDFLSSGTPDASLLSM